MTAIAEKHPVVSSEEWLEARKALLAEEKTLTRLRDALSRKRQQLPWVRVEKNYVFDGPKGKETLGDLLPGGINLSCTTSCSVRGGARAVRDVRWRRIITIAASFISHSVM